ncbi:MAG: GNAT family N-acetyltransferase [Erysipelotrichaceae bacterium]|nr:GNAT family N-acetyltransferase [Erysipelotrichaceae bacterium]
MKHIETSRTYFKWWKREDLPLARILWGDQEVTKYISANGRFNEQQILQRLETEIKNGEMYQIQYWPFYQKDTNELIGCCGLRPYDETTLELGFHLRPQYWNQGYATEVAKAVIDYAFDILQVPRVFAGHNPHNIISKKVLQKLNFTYIQDEYYAPTGLYHPSYELTKESRGNTMENNYYYQCGVIDAFNEIIRADVKQLALSHPTTKEDIEKVIPFTQEITQEYGTKYEVEEHLLITDLFPYSSNLGKTVILFWKNDEVIHKYHELKNRKQKALENNTYNEIREEIAREFGRLLSYSEESITKFIAENPEKETF